MELIPFTNLPLFRQGFRIVEGGEQRRRLTCSCPCQDNLAAIGGIRLRRTSAARAGAALDQCACVGICIVDVCLVAAGLPLRSRIPGHLTQSYRAKLYAAVSARAFELQFKLEL